METKLCSKCGKVKPLTEFYLHKSGKKKGKLRSECSYCDRMQRLEYRKSHREEENRKDREREYSRGASPARENKACPKYLGIIIAETVLSHFFDHLEHMPENTPGYDFICGKGFKIDAKSSALHHPKNHNEQWLFSIKRNQIADYFLFLAFSDRETLEPVHVWLIPASQVNTKSCIGIYNTPKSLLKWQPYEKPLDRVIHCCNRLRDTEETIYF